MIVPGVLHEGVAGSMSTNETVGVTIHDRVNRRVFSAMAKLARDVKTDTTWWVESAATHALTRYIARGVTSQVIFFAA